MTRIIHEVIFILSRKRSIYQLRCMGGCFRPQILTKEENLEGIWDGEGGEKRTKLAWLTSFSTEQCNESTRSSLKFSSRGGSSQAGSKESSFDSSLLPLTSEASSVSFWGRNLWLFWTKRIFGGAKESSTTIQEMVSEANGVWFWNLISTQIEQ